MAEKKSKIPPSKNQQRAIDELGNVVVSAGAGSGKTRVLSFRFAKMVEKDGTKADKILTLTFTNKSAVEMKQRIFAQLSEDSVDEEKSLEERIRAKEAIQNFDKTHIQTLDSYFSEIVRLGAHFYGITPSFRIDEDNVNSLVLTKALQFVLSRSQNFAIQALTREFKFEEIAKNVFADTVLYHSSIVSSHTKFSEKISVQRDKIKEVWKKYAALADDLVGKSLNCDIAPDCKPSDTDKKNLEALNELNNIPQVMNTVSQDDFWDNIDDKKIQEINEYISYLGLWTKAFSRLAQKKFPELYENLYGQNKEGGLFDVINRLVCAANYICNFKISEEILRLLDEFDIEVQNAKRTAGTLLFDDVSTLAFDILKNHSDIRHIEQEKFDRIMIDEFQDNDQRQCDVLFMLSDIDEKFDGSNYIVPSFKNSTESVEEVRARLSPQKLFFVGDEKQSIYRFRNADVSVFRSLQKNLRGTKIPETDENGKAIDEEFLKNYIYLETNYRSMPNLVEGFNTIFGGDNIKNAPSALMKVEDEVSIPEYEAEYLKVEFAKNKLEKEPDRTKPRIHFAMYNTKSADDVNSEDSNKEVEASYVAKKIQELHKNGVDYGKIALLFRTSTGFQSYEDELLKAHIPYSTEVFKGFFTDGPVNDIVSFLKICVYPEDWNALSKLLCSPFVNLSREEMQVFMSLLKNKKKELHDIADSEIEIAQDDVKLKTKTSIYPFDEIFMEVAKNLFGEESSTFSKILNAKNNYEITKYSIKNENISSIVSKLWYEFGYRYESLWNQDVQMFSTLYDIFYELARRSDEESKSLAGFLDNIESFNSDTAKIDGLDVPFEVEDSVKILTIHKSKGLEYEYVFVCNVKAGSRSFGSPCEFTKDYGIVVTLPSISSFKKVKPQGDGDFVYTTSANYFILEDKIQSSKEDAAELRRLTYVAFTRAINELFVVGTFSGIDPSKKNVMGLSKTDLDKNLYLEVFSEKPSNIFGSISTILNKFIELENPSDKESRRCVQKKNLNYPLSYEEFYEKFKYDGNFDSFDNSDLNKNIFASEKNSIYENSTLILKDYIKPVSLKPSSLESYVAGNENFVAPMSEIDEIVKSTVIEDRSRNSNENYPNVMEENENPDVETDSDENKKKSPERYRFDYADFGSIAHAYLEEKINSVKENRDFNPQLPEKFFIGLDIDIKSFIRNKSADGNKNDYKKPSDFFEVNKAKVEAICEKMVDNFSQTELFDEICKSEWKRAEYIFKLSRETQNHVAQKNSAVINGMMDLVFKNPNLNDKYKFTIVDYKTDKEQLSEKYLGQLACYRLAVSEMKGVKFEEVRCILYYLRYDSKVAAVDVTEKCTLEKLDFAIGKYLAIDFNRFKKNNSYIAPLSAEELEEEKKEEQFIFNQSELEYDDDE